MPARVPRGEAHRGAAGGRRRSVQRRSGLGGVERPTDVHAEAMELAVVSTSSR
jgi:hypothetical protein